VQEELAPSIDVKMRAKVAKVDLKNTTITVEEGEH